MQQRLKLAERRSPTAMSTLLLRRAPRLTPLVARARGLAASRGVVLEVVEEDDYQKAIGGEGLTTVYWTAAWCGPCKMIAPIYSEVRRSRDPTNPPPTPKAIGYCCCRSSPRRTRTRLSSRLTWTRPPSSPRPPASQRCPPSTSTRCALHAGAAACYPNVHTRAASEPPERSRPTSPTGRPARRPDRWRRPAEAQRLCARAQRLTEDCVGCARRRPAGWHIWSVGRFRRSGVRGVAHTSHHVTHWSRARSDAARAVSGETRDLSTLERTGES